MQLRLPRYRRPLDAWDAALFCGGMIVCDGIGFVLGAGAPGHFFAVIAGVALLVTRRALAPSRPPR